MAQRRLGDNMPEKQSPRLVSAVDEAGSVLCVYDSDNRGDTKGTWQAIVRVRIVSE